MRKSTALIILATAAAFLSNAATARAPIDKARTNRIRIEYALPKNPAHQGLYEMVRERRVLEILQEIYSPFRLPTELRLKTMGCDGLRDAWYDTDDSVPTVHICYELLQDILQTVPNEVTPAGITPHDAVVGQILFWVSHEVGHAIFDIFQVPVLGREEDAADQFSGYILLHFGKDQARRLVGGAAYSFNKFVKNYKENPGVEKPLEKYSNVHGLPEQRFYNLVCLAYGADPKLYADVVENGYLPKSRAENCDYEFQTFSRAWRAVIRPHIDQKRAKAVLDISWLARTSAKPVRR